MPQKIESPELPVITKEFVPTPPPQQVVTQESVPPSFNAAYLHNPAPVYPAAAKARRLRGLVLLQVNVSADGTPEQIEIIKSSGSNILDQAATVAVREWRFAPARRGDRTVPGVVQVPINFVGAGQ